MKLEDLVYRVAGETLAMLEKKYHYHVSEEHKQDIQKAIKENVHTIMKTAKEN